MKKCKLCNKQIIDKKHKDRIYCSHSCASIDMVRKPSQGFQKGHPSYSKKGRFGIGNIPHNKGIVGYQNKGTFQKGHEPLLMQDGELNSQWKGDAVGYSGLHSWVRKNLGTPSICEHCNDSTKSRYEWANKSHKYKRDTSDWIRLCCSCHQKYDRASGRYEAHLN